MRDCVGWPRDLLIQSVCPGEKPDLSKAKSDKLCIENLEGILSILRHELGNPVTSLKITLDVLRESYDLFDESKKRAYLSRASELVVRQEKIIEALKYYSKFSVKEKENISFHTFWKKFSIMVSNKLKDGNIRLINDLRAGPCLIQANNPALNRIMASIIDNAVEALAGVDEPTIELKAVKTNGFVKIALKDNGPGIRENDMARVFVPLFTTKPGKMGMGLTIAGKLTWEMGGRVEIESLSGSGTEAIVWLKAVKDRPKKPSQS
jgi:two-component system C4-dicarboxylate transport sensor histidine kinase DctB